MSIETELLLTIDFEDVLEDFANEKARKTPYQTILTRIIISEHPKLHFIL